MKIILVLILLSSLEAGEQISPKLVSAQQGQQMAQQFRNSQMIQAQMELKKVQTDLNQKKQEKADLLEQLKDLSGPQSAAKALKLNSKIKKIAQAELQIKNKVQQLDIDIKELETKQISLTKSLNN